MRFIQYLRHHNKNDDTPYVLGGAAGIVVFIIVAIFGLSVIGRYSLTTQNLAAVISSVLVDLANGDRSVNQLGGLTINPTLALAAEAKANDMAAKGYFAHVSPEGKNSWHWFTQAGYAFTYAGENLAVDFSDSIDVERAWMNSPTHRANILNGHYTEIGIATAQGFYQGRVTTFVVQMFGSPAAAPLPITTATLPASPTVPATASAVIVTTSPEPTQSPVLGATSESVGAVAATDVSPWWAHIVAAPRTTLKYAYYGVALFIFILLAFVTRFELRRHHRHHVVAVGVLFILMAGLFAFASAVFFTVPTLAAGL